MTDEHAAVPSDTATLAPALSSDGMAGDSVAVAGWTIASRVTGFFRVVAIAAVLGPTFFGNLFEATNLLPNLAFELLTGPLIAALLIPHLVRHLDSKMGASAQRLASGFLGVLTLVFTAAIVLAIAVGPLLLGLLTILVPDVSVRTAQLSVGWPLLALLMPQALFYAIASTGVAVQNAHGKFALAAAAPALENIGIIVVMGVSALVFGVGLDVAEVTTPHLLLLGLGTTGAVALHAGVQWWGAHRAGTTLIPRWGWRDKEVRQILKLGVPSSGFAALTALRTIGLLIVAGSIPGGVIAFQLGRYFFNFPVAVAARPVTVAQLPRLSRAFNEGNHQKFLAIYRNGVDLILFVAVPASLLIIALAEPLARVTAYGEMASTSGIALAALAIGILAVGIVGESLFLAATSAFYSMRNARAPLVATAWRLGITVVGGLIAVTVGEGLAVLAILALGVAVADLVTGIRLHGALQRHLPSLGPPSRSTRVVNVVIAAIAVGIGAAFAFVTRNLTDGGRFMEAAVGTTAVVVAYVVMQWSRHSPELEELTAVFRIPHNSERIWFRVGPALAIGLATILTYFAGTIVIGVVLGLAVMALIAIRPAVGAYLYLAVTPLVAGISRDVALPLLRIHEAFLLLIIGALVLRGLVRMLKGHRYAPVVSRVDVAVAALAVTGSLVSMLWRFSQGEPITSDDIFYAAVFWKYLALYVVFRVTVRTPGAARIALWVALTTTAVVGFVAILQALGLFGVPELLFELYPPFLGESADIGRGASTLALTFAVADISLICLGAAIVLLREATGRKRGVLIGLAMLYLLSAIAAGQFSGFIGIVVAALALGYALGETRRVLRYGVPGSLVGGLILLPVISERLAGFRAGDGIPQSWTGRLDNLTRFILPEFGNGWNLVFGVRPAARVPAPESWRDWVFIESGYIWLLWSGGISLLLAFYYFTMVCIRSLRATMAAHTVEVRSIATAAFVGLWVIVVLTVFDPHLTMRGVADLMFPLLAMAQIARPSSRARRPDADDRNLVMA